MEYVLSDHGRYLESCNLYTTLLGAFTKVALDRPKSLELWVAVYLLGLSKTVKQVELQDGSVLVLKQDAEGLAQHAPAMKGNNFKNVLTSGSNSLRDQGWVSSTETMQMHRGSKTRVPKAEKSSLDDKPEYLKNSILYATMVRALKQMSLERPKHQELWMALFLLGQSRTAKRVELADGTVLALKHATEVKIFEGIITTTLSSQGWANANSVETQNRDQSNLANQPKATNVTDDQSGMLVHSALIFDCGTSDTKAIRLEFKETVHDKQLSLKVESIAPTVLSFLGSPEPVTISETKPYQDMVQKAQNANERAPDITKYFLKSKKKVKNDYIINENDFIEWVLEQKAQKHANNVVLGSSGWYRGASGADLEKANKIIKRLTSKGVFCPKLESNEESVYEAASAAYAAHAVGSGKIDAVIDVEANSLKCMYKMETMIKLDCGWRLGQNATEVEYRKDPNAETALKAADEYVNLKILDMQKNTGQLEKQTGKVLSLADIGNGHRQFVDGVRATVYVFKLKQKVSELEADAKKNPKVFFSGQCTETLVKVKLQIKLLETFFDLSKTTLCFKSDWKLPGGVPFFTTWAAGWYMNYLQSLGIELDGSKDVLKVLEQQQQEANSDQVKEPIKLADYSALVQNMNFMQEANSAKQKLMTKHSALVFDCGTGETKAILLAFSDGVIRFKEKSVAPAVLSFMSSPKPVTIAETKPFQDLKKKAEKNGKPTPAITKYFLENKDPVDAQYTINTDDFVRWVLEQQNINMANYIMVNSSDWDQVGLDSSGSEKRAKALVNTLMKNGLFCKKINEAEEALYEAASVSYAAYCLGVKNVDAVIGAGGASVQYMYRMRTAIMLNCGFRNGVPAMKNEYAKKGNIEDALKATDDYINDVVVGCEIKQAIDRCHKLGFTDRSGNIIKQRGTVMCISACYHAARAAGIENKDDEANPIIMSKCIEKFKNKVDELEAKARKNPAKFMAGRNTTNLVNLKIQTKAFETFFHSDAKLIFKRNWILPGKVPFRTTWSSGWYLQHLLELGVYFDGTREVLQSLKEEVPISEDRTLVFDCGSGETKAMYLEYSNTGRNQIMSVRQISLAPAVLSFLESPKPVTIAETKPFQDLKKKAKKKGKPAPAITKYFLENKDPVDAQYTINADDFVEWILEQRKLNKANTVTIGTSGWHRVAGADFHASGAADTLVHRLQKHGIKCKMLNHKEEAYFEAASVAYAACASGVDKVDAVIGSGGGSVQYMYRMRTVIGLNCGFKMGQNAMKDMYAKTKDIESALKVADDYVNHANHDKASGNVAGRVGHEINQAVRLCRDKDAKHANAIKKLKGTVMCISACYYAAQAAGIENKDNEVNAISMSECVEKFKTVVDKLKTEAKKNPAKFMAGRNTMTLVNLKIQIKLFETFFDSEARLIFKRNWLLPGKAPFRTTWSSGFFLSQLAKKGVCLPGTKEVLDNLNRVQEAGAKVLSEKSINLMNCNVDNLGMVLVSFEGAVDYITELALQIGEVVTPILQEIAAKYHGRMEGLEFHVKGKESLMRKLISKVVEMSNAHRGKSSFSPNLSKCIETIHDALRYTIIFPRKYYTEGVKGVEDCLMDGVGKERFAFEGLGKKFKAKNSWKRRDDETTYMGINSQVTLKFVTYTGKDGKKKSIPMSDNYVFELQFHTPGSFKLKNEDSHLFYEALRNDEIKAGTIPPKLHEKYSKNDQLLKGIPFKVQLYKCLKAMWNVKDENGSPKVPGRQYLGGITYEPFKPEDMSIVEYRGRMTAKNLSKFEGKQCNSIGSLGELYESKWIAVNRKISKWETFM